MDRDEHEEIEGLDDYDRQRASDMEESCPIYPQPIVIEAEEEELDTVEAEA